MRYFDDHTSLLTQQNVTQKHHPKIVQGNVSLKNNSGHAPYHFGMHDRQIFMKEDKKFIQSPQKIKF